MHLHSICPHRSNLETNARDEKQWWDFRFRSYSDRMGGCYGEWYGVFVVVVAVVAVVVLQASHIRVSCRTLDSPSLGNEYWIGRLGASGDPAAACCSLIPQLQDPHVNPTLRGCNTVCVFG